MEFVRPNAEIWEQGNTLEDIWKHIARCTRVCYQSTPKNNGETDEKFVKRVILKGNLLWRGTDFDSIHGAMLEHGTVYLKHYKGNIGRMWEASKYSKVNYSSNMAYITTNLRVLYENNWQICIFFKIN